MHDNNNQGSCVHDLYTLNINMVVRYLCRAVGIETEVIVYLLYVGDMVSVPVRDDLKYAYITPPIATR